MKSRERNAWIALTVAAVSTALYGGGVIESRRAHQRAVSELRVLDQTRISAISGIEDQKNDEDGRILRAAGPRERFIDVRLLNSIREDQEKKVTASIASLKHEIESDYLDPNRPPKYLGLKTAPIPMNAPTQKQLDAKNDELQIQIKQIGETADSEVDKKLGELLKKN